MLDNPSLLFQLAENDKRCYFAFDISKNQFVYINNSFKEFFDSAAIGENARRIIAALHPEDKYLLKELWSNTSSPCFFNNVELRISDPSRSQRWICLSAHCSINTGSTVFLTGYFNDITKAKKHSQTLNEFANKKNAILNILAHDLIGPLGSIQNIAELLSIETNTLQNEQMEKLIAVLKNVSKRSVGMIQNFIKQEFLESAGVDMVKRRENVVERIGFLLEAYMEPAHPIAHSFEFTYSKPVIYAEIDESKFLQAINNLIINSLKFTPAGGTISIHISEVANKVLIRVSDTGIGIPEKFHANIFDKFNGAGRTGLNGEPSNGLGMSIIKTIIGWHKGTITLDNSVTFGTSFLIEILGDEV